ncbi:MAG: signal peptidase I [Dehalococcoidia bacterium]|nr:Signal peptidase I U [Chloroflexota bacterium]MBT9162802.1 Signal peptidase I U [Chloroflexota bacterium]
MKAAIREILTTVLLALLIFVAIRAVVHNFEVNGFSMEPNLHHGQFIIVSKAAYWFSNPLRGDIVVFQTGRPNHGIIHRIVGLPGELIEIRNGELYVNGEKLEEPYVRVRSVSVSPRKVPHDSYFIVGDNRAATSWDIVPRRNIIGRAWLIYWPISDWGMAPNHSWESGVGGVKGSST